MRMQPGFRAIGVRSEAAGQRPELVRMIHVNEMRHFVGREIVDTSAGAMIRRHEKFSEPLAEQEPQRLVVSRTVIRRAEKPSEPACLRTAASRSFLASRFKKS